MSTLRIWARLSMVLLLGAVALFISSSIYKEKWMIIMALLFILLSAGIKLFKLKCANCGWRGRVSQLSRNKSYECPKCGASFGDED